jgi:CheY-like chemotaxis protein
VTDPSPTELRRVLVVDDDEDLRAALVLALRDAGIAASQARDGVDALDKLRAEPRPCALLLDMNMPRLDGAAVLSALRAEPALHTLPVITMTAGACPPAVDAFGQLVKPFELARLLGLLFDACRACGACEAGGPVVGAVVAARRAADLARGR